MATYRISFNANGGSGAPGSLMGDTTPQITIDGGTYYYAAVKLPSNKPSRTYYNFLGWSSSSSASSAAYAAGGTYTVNTTSTSFVTTLYAVWQHQTAYVYYNANGGSGAPSTQSHWAGYSVTLSATSPTRNGYTFLGWATSASATSASYQPGGTYSLYTTTTLYAVWKSAASTLTASNGNLGDAITIGITRQNNAYTDTITYSFGTANGTIVTKTNNASVTWTPPISLATEIPNSSTGTCTLTCTTYNGNTVVGTTTKTITLTVPDSLAPTVSVSYADTIAQCLAWGLLVQSRSKLSFTITASGQQGATIATYSTSVNGTSYNSDTFTTDVLLYNGTNSYSVTVTDSRGKQTVSTGNFSVVAYSNPSLTLTLCDRNDSDPDQVDVAFDFSVASVSSNNDANYRLDYKLKSASIWTNGTVQNLGAYSGSISDFIANLDGGDEWDIRINVIDSFQTASVESEVGVSGNILLNSRHNGGLGILMKSQADDQCDIGKKTVFHETVDVIPRRAYATLSSAGWYRVLTYDSYHADRVLGDVAYRINITLFDWARQMHEITFVCLWGSIKWIDEKSVTTNTNFIDKIRYTQNGSYGYIDVHYTDSSSRKLSCHFDVKADYDSIQSEISANDFVAVADAPVGETILTTYKFNANTPFVVEYGTSNGWEYQLYNNKKIIATRTITTQLTHYTTFSGFYGYYITNIAVPLTMANTDYYVGCTWSIGSGFSIPAGLLSITTNKFNAYALSTGSGTNSVTLKLYLEGYKE